jgi:hypothetical protein
VQNINQIPPGICPLAKALLIDVVGDRRQFESSATPLSVIACSIWATILLPKIAGLGKITVANHGAGGEFAGMAGGDP